MKILKYLLFLILIVVIAGSIYIATKDGDYHVEKSVVIPADSEIVYNEVNELENWENWDPWAEENRDIIREYDENTRGEGAAYTWKNGQHGDGNIIITNTKPFSEINQQAVFESSFSTSTSDMYWRFNEKGDSTKVTWGIKGNQNFMEKLANSLKSEPFPENLNPQLENGLEQLKAAVKKRMERYSVNVDGIIQHGGGYYMYTTTSAKFSQIGDRRQKMIADVIAYMENNNIEISGKPLVIYNEWNQNEGTTIFSAGVFTASEIVTPENSQILSGNLPDQKVLRTTLKGNYSNLMEARETALKYIEENNLEINEDEEIFEVFITGPDSRPNPANWITQLHIPIK